MLMSFILHSIAGFVIYGIFRPYTYTMGLIMVVLAGVGKEVHDFYFGGDVEATDIIFTVFGAVIYEILYKIFRAYKALK